VFRPTGLEENLYGIGVRRELACEICEEKVWINEVKSHPQELNVGTVSMEVIGDDDS